LLSSKTGHYSILKIFTDKIMNMIVNYKEISNYIENILTDLYMIFNLIDFQFDSANLE
jgi:hypothetical protein